MRLYADPETAQRAVDALHAASSELKFDERQIVIVSGEPHEGYEFADSHVTNRPYRWAVLGAAIGGTCGYLLDHADRRSLIRLSPAVCPLRPRGPTASSSTK